MLTIIIYTYTFKILFNDRDIHILITIGYLLMLLYQIKFSQSRHVSLKQHHKKVLVTVWFEYLGSHIR